MHGAGIESGTVVSRNGGSGTESPVAAGREGPLWGGVAEGASGTESREGRTASSEPASPVSQPAEAAPPGRNEPPSNELSAAADVVSTPGAPQQAGPASPAPPAAPSLDALLARVSPAHEASFVAFVVGLRAAGWGEKRVRELVAGVLSLEPVACDQVLDILEDLATPARADGGPDRVRGIAVPSLGAAAAPSPSIAPVDAERFAIHVRHTYLRTERDRQREREDLAREVVAMKARAEKRAKRRERGRRDREGKGRSRWEPVKDPSPAAALARRVRERGHRRMGAEATTSGAPLAASSPTTALPPAREALPSLDGPLPSLDALLPLVGPEYREQIEFYLLDLDIGGWSVEERARHLALIVRLPVERREIALYHLTTLRGGKIDAAIISQQIAHLFLRPPEQAVLVARAMGEGASTGTGPRGPYYTFPRGRLGAVVTEHPGIATADAAREAGLTAESARIALNDFERLGLVVRTRYAGRPDAWSATVDLVTLVFHAAGGSQVLAMGSTIPTDRETHGEHLGPRPSEVLEQQHKAYKRLKAMGMEDRLALRTVRKHRFDFVNRQIANVEKYAKEGKVESMGALLNFRFWGKHQEQRRHIGLVTKVVPGKLREVYLQATKDAPLPISIHLAYKLKKIQDNGKDLEPWEVWGILNDIRKEDDNRQARQGA